MVWLSSVKPKGEGLREPSQPDTRTHSTSFHLPSEENHTASSSSVLRTRVLRDPCQPLKGRTHTPLCPYVQIRTGSCLPPFETQFATNGAGRCQRDL